MADRVLASSRIEDQQNFMRSAGDYFVHYPPDLSQFVHQIALRLQSASGIDNANLGAIGFGFFDRLVGDAGRVATLFTRYDFTAQSLRPNR